MRRIFFLIAVIAVAATPVAAVAAPSWIPIVPCGVQGSGGNPVPCSPCHLFQGVKNVTDLILFGITGPIAAFMVTLAGGMMLLGGASVAQYSRGKELLKNTLSGVTVILLAWVATNFLVKSVGAGSTADAWYQFTCPTFLEDIENVELDLPTGYGVVPPAPAASGKPFVSLPSGVNDATLAAIAAVNGAKYPAQNSPALERLISCIYADPIISALAAPRPPSTGPQRGNTFTYDGSYDACNYTHGAAIFGGRCSHSRYSCHYGGKKGANGAEAIDINARETRVALPGRVDVNGDPMFVPATEIRLFCELHRLLVKEDKCPDFKYLDMHNNHNHISTTSCDSDGAGAGTTTNAEACKSLLALPSGSLPQ